MPHFSGDRIDTDILAYGIWHSIVTDRKLPKNVYKYNVNKLSEGIFKGYKVNRFTLHVHSPDFKMLEHLNTNVHIFSAAKTFQQTKEMSELMAKITGAKAGDIVKTNNAKVEVTTNRFSNFKEGVKQISDIYNETWLSTEYQTALSGARNASLWQRIQESKEALPNLTYHTDEQDTVCPICEPLDNLTAPVDDPIWDEIYPDQHFDCHCYVSQEDETVDLTPDDEKDELYDNATELMQPMFKRNVGKDGEIFNKHAPYFSVPSADKEFARNNFGLKVDTTYSEAWQK